MTEHLELTLHFPALEKAMAIRSSVLAWTIPGSGEPGGLLSMGSHRVRHNWSDLAAGAALHPHGAGGGTGRKVFKWAGARLGEGPRKGPPGAGRREAAPHPGPGGNRGQWRHLSSVLIVMGKEMTSSTFCPVLPFKAEAKGATQRTC